MVYSINHRVERGNMGVLLNLQTTKKEIEDIVNIEEDKIYFILKFFRYEIAEMDDINLTKKEQVILFNKILNRQIPYQSYVDFYKKYIQGKRRIRKKSSDMRNEVYENIENVNEKYTENWVTKEMARTGKTEGEIYGI